MDKGIYTIHNGKLLYQLRKGGLFYDMKTRKPISKQPNMAVRQWKEPWKEDNVEEDKT